MLVYWPTIFVLFFLKSYKSFFSLLTGLRINTDTIMSVILRWLVNVIAYTLNSCSRKIEPTQIYASFCLFTIVCVPTFPYWPECSGKVASDFDNELYGFDFAFRCSVRRLQRDFEQILGRRTKDPASISAHCTSSPHDLSTLTSFGGYEMITSKF